ncbi:T9SS type A sorting domain-containing protein [Cryomorphaceae bacterium 1068]|nr:T9SS type A sorting domain-containing protein [Cryomorphaceae bacterium 1068]
MKTQTTVILAFIAVYFCTSLKAQSFQYSKQKGTLNHFSSSLSSVEGAFIGSEVVLGPNFTTTSNLFSVNEEGNTLWEVEADYDGEVVTYQNLVAISDSTFGALGYRIECCDCSEPFPFYELRRISDGTLLDYSDSALNQEAMQTSFFNQELKVSANTWGFSIVQFGVEPTTAYYFSQQGEALNTFELEQGFEAVGDLEGDFIVSSANVLRRYDESGIKVDSVEVIGLPTTISSNNQSLAVLINNQVFVYSSQLDLLGSVSVEAGLGLMSDFEGGFALYTGEDIIIISNEGEMVGQNEFVNIQGFEPSHMSANSDGIFLTGSKVSDQFSFFNIRHEYSAYRATTHGGAFQLWNSDLEITEVTVENAAVTSSDEFSLSFSSDLWVTVRNSGTFPVSSFYLNFVDAFGICTPEIGHLQVNDGLGNGDEMTVLFSDVEGFLFTGGEENPPVEACVFVTQPDLDIDINRDNDSECIDLSPFLSVSDIAIERRINLFPNPATAEFRIESDLLIHSYQIFDAFGRRIQEGVVNQGNLVEIENFPNGIFVVKITTDKGIATKKVVVSH